MNEGESEVGVGVVDIPPTMPLVSMTVISLKSINAISSSLVITMTLSSIIDCNTSMLGMYVCCEEDEAGASWDGGK